MSQENLFEQEEQSQSNDNEPVECLGMTFENDKARREHFTEILREKLKDPAFRKIEGFPLGEDEDILELSDPPYYTACPNPFLEEFVRLNGTPYDPDVPYSREPYAADVSEGKNDPIYNAHSYHTKVPHKAIMRYILHYTEPGDLVFDGFCGTGMTGVAAQLCGDKETVESLGYQVKDDGSILQKEINENEQESWVPISKIGVRKTILNDLSPAATFIATNYNTKISLDAFEQDVKCVIDELKKECAWMYETVHTDGKTKGVINYTVWSDVFVCPECAGEITFWEEAVNEKIGKIRDVFPCPYCSCELTKRKMERSKTNYFDSSLGESTLQTKSVPVLINYSINGKRKSLKKKPDRFDFDLIDKINNAKFRNWYPNYLIVDGDKTPEATRQGYLRISHLFTRRNLLAFSVAWNEAPRKLMWAVTGSILRGSKQHQIAISRIGGEKAGVGGATAGHRRGTLYIPSNQVEMSVILLLKERFNQIKKSINKLKCDSFIQTSSITGCHQLRKNSLDYIFIDPPFGANIMYSELNQTWESWLKVFTNNIDEAIQNKSQKKDINIYHRLMKSAFCKIYEVLKPGRWMTVEFSNTKASVWNIIQSSISESGFIIANVSSLNKGRGGLNAIVGVTAVKQDLIISAYKPDVGFIQRFEKEQPIDGVWDFVRTHLKYLPVIKKQAGEMVIIPERDPRILFDQMVSYFFRKGHPVPLSTQEFQQGLSTRFAERDGMVFLEDQVYEYEKKRITASQLKQLTIFVDDEASGIEWLRQTLSDKPMTTQDIQPFFMQERSGWKKNEKVLELSHLLEENFIKYDGLDDVPTQIRNYLSRNFKDMRHLELDDSSLKTKAKDRWYVPDPNKSADLEKLRTRTLLREFATYKESKKKIKQPRGEALRAGFKKAWEDQEFQTILDMAKKIPPIVLQEDEKLLMFYDNAVTRTTDEDDVPW